MFFRLPFLSLLASFVPLVVSTSVRSSISASSPESVESISDSSPESVDECEIDILLSLVECAGLTPALPDKTVFGPCNYAFVDFLDDTGLSAELLCGPLIDDLEKILLYHVIDGEFLAEDILDFPGKKNKLPTLLEGKYVTVNRDKLTVNGVKIVDPDKLLDDPVLHGIAEVLIPPGFFGSDSGESESKSGKGGKGKGGKGGKSGSNSGSKSGKGGKGKGGNSRSNGGSNPPLGAQPPIGFFDPLGRHLTLYSHSNHVQPIKDRETNTPRSTKN